MEILFAVIGIILFLFGFVVFFGAPYVPSLKKDMRIAFDELYPVSTADVVLDVGSGDGTVLREVAKRGGKAVGYEINPILVVLSMFFSIRNKKVQIKWKNFWTESFPENTTLVYVFIVSRDTKRLKKKIEQQIEVCKKPIYVLSYGAEIPDCKPVKQAGAHHLYKFVPLQTKKAQV